MAKKKKSNKKPLKTSRTKRKPTSKKSPEKKFTIPNTILIAISLVITTLVYMPSINNDFVNWDDDVNVYENENTTGLTSDNIKKIFSEDVIGNYNPLTILTFAAERHFAGLNPQVMHINNLLLHLLCVLLIFTILVQLKLNPLWATVGALLFGIHPMRVESVAWITERKDVLFGVFFLAAIWQYLLWIRKEDRKLWRYILITILIILSLLSKIQAVAFPLAVLCIDYWMNRPINWKLVIEKIPFFLLSLVTGLIGVFMLTDQGSIDSSSDIFGFVDRIFIASFTLVTYLYKLIIPYPLSPLYPYPHELGWFHYISILMPIGLLGLLYWSFKKARPIFFGLLFFSS